MRTEYDPNLIEEAVRLAARGDRQVERALHAAIDSIYTQPDADTRDADFRRAFASFFFTTLRLDRPVTEVIEAFPLVETKVERCVVRRAPHRKGERADLLIRIADSPRAIPSATRNPKSATPGSPPLPLSPSPPLSDRASIPAFTLVVLVCPESLFDPSGWHHRMRRELLFASDMLDPAFDYRLELPAGPTTRRNLVRDRYQVLWSIYVEGRLNEEPNRSDAPPALRQAFCRAFACADDDRIREAVNLLFHARGLTHARLMQWAENPEQLFTAAGGCTAHLLCSAT